MLKRYLVLPCLLVVSAFALVACGSSGSSDEGQIEEAIEASVIGADPASCSEVATAAFVEQTEQAQGAEALKKCEEEAEDTSNDPESVTISAVAVEGSKATADVAFVGSSFDGQAVAVGLVKDGDQWKLDRLVKFAKFDKQALVSAFEEELTKGPKALSESQAACVVESLEAASDAEIEEALLARTESALESLLGGC